MKPASRLVSIGDLSLGQESAHRAHVDRAMVEAYARMSGDYNPVHIDEEYAATTRFGKPIAHGLLVAGFVQTALTQLVTPGGISTKYSFSLVGPVPVGSEVVAKVRCFAIDVERRRATFELEVVVVGGDVAVRGQAEIAFPRASKQEEE